VRARASHAGGRLVRANFLPMQDVDVERIGAKAKGQEVGSGHARNIRAAGMVLAGQQAPGLNMSIGWVFIDTGQLAKNNGTWREATPAFNLSLCKKFGLLPLEFDGVHNPLHNPLHHPIHHPLHQPHHHPCGRAGQRHRGCANEHASLGDLPWAQMCAFFAKAYPRLVDPAGATGNFAEDAAREMSRPTATEAGPG
jgi:hypothetical protein